MPNGAQAVVLCEGLQDFVFLRRTLLELGYESRRIRPLMQPHNGKGSGEQYVRERYADEVRSHRSRVARMKTVLIVHTDADSGTVQERYDSLDERLEAAGLSRRGAREAIAVLIPKRNTETWIHFFDGLSVDEENSISQIDGSRIGCAACSRDVCRIREKRYDAGTCFPLPHPRAARNAASSLALLRHFVYYACRSLVFRHSPSTASINRRSRVGRPLNYRRERPKARATERRIRRHFERCRPNGACRRVMLARRPAWDACRSVREANPAGWGPRQICWHLCPHTCCSDYHRPLVYEPISLVRFT